MPPNNKEVLHLKNLAILPFYWPYGKEFAAKIEAMIMNKNVTDGKVYYKLVERAEIKKVVDEMSFSSSYFVNQDTAINIGRMLGAQGIMVGTISGAAVQDNPYSEKRVRCGQYQNNVVKGPNGPVTIPVCVRWDPY
ncbi:MAG: penicillin-binding protein activator LpoB [Calditerrivibrio sp.]|nr:penicillin-binding protein activator LpoB [Calditerrivibrio sp.]